MPKDDDSRESPNPWDDKWRQSFQVDRDMIMGKIREGEEQLKKDLEKENSFGGDSFAAFKRFIDGSFSALTRRIVDFPANVQQVMRRSQLRAEEEQDISKRWTGSSDSPDCVNRRSSQCTPDETQAAREATEQLLMEAWVRNEHVPIDKIRELFYDPEGGLGSFDQDFDASWAGGRRYSPRWLSVEWFKRSPYSPIRLEAHPQLGESGSRWRAAFEDLLNATLDKPVDSRERFGQREPHGKPQSTYYGPGLDWMLSLQCRGILPPLTPRYYSFNFKPRANDWLAQIMRASKMSESNAHTPSWYLSYAEKDFLDLMREVATKSTTEAHSESSTMTQPRTELDMYESPQLYDGYGRPIPQTGSSTTYESQRPATVVPPVEDPSTTEVSRASPVRVTQASPTVSLTGDYIADFNEADDALEEALMDDNAVAAADILNAWYKQYQDVSELVDMRFEEHMLTDDRATTCEWFSVLTKALRDSKLPEEDQWKQVAHTFTHRPHEETLRREQLIARGNELAGQYLTWRPSWSTEQMEERVLQLEEEYENLKRLTGEDKVGSKDPVKEETATKRPDVLSALTTTHTSRLPDGTVTTKVVLKQRFADGREETMESVHTTKEKLEEPTEGESEEKKGWFWS